MSSIEDRIAEHYTTGRLVDRIRAALAQAGVDPDRAAPADLKPVDEFHIGGLAATEALLEHVALTPESKVLDIGSGLGGTARLIAGRAGCHVTGIDLTEEFVATAKALSAMVGLGERTSFRTGSALAMPFGDDSFDVAFLLHVGMNIADKPALMAEAARVLRPGAPFVVYEVMRSGEGKLAYPVPWAATPETSFVGTPEDYTQAARAAGFTVEATRDRRDFALDFFARLKAAIAASGPPPLGIHLLMGETAGAKVDNMIANIEAGRIAPTEMFLHAPAA